MELNEAVGQMEIVTSEKPMCQQKDEPENRGWKCRIGPSGSPGDEDAPTPERLYANMKSAEVALPDPPARKQGLWDLFQCTPDRYPFQSHHLIPKKHLPKKAVCVWLAKNAANKQYKLTESTNYDTDDARNGMPLPFASTTYQWVNGSPAQDRICNLMMYLTQRQLHQGQHTYTDYGEEESLHAKEWPGYLGAVDRLLDVVHGQMICHMRVCEHCKKNAGPPLSVRPLERVVEAMHQVSQLIGGMITARTIFVSRRASQYTQPELPEE